MRGRLHGGNIDFLQLFDVTQDVTQLLGELLFFVARQRNAREMRDIFNIDFSGCHAAEGNGEWRARKSKSSSWYTPPRNFSIFQPRERQLQWRPMYPAVVTKDPTAVAREVNSVYGAIIQNGDPEFVPRIFGWVTECFSGYCDYLPIDVPYHDLEHTMQGTLCMARLLRGWHRAGAAPALTREGVELGLLAILLHDTGYLKRKGDTTGTGAKYTLVHVKRSAEFAQGFLKERGFAMEEIRAVQCMIQCTGFNDDLNALPFRNDLERRLGYALGTADLLGQMAADDYVERLPELYLEFAEAASFAGAQGNRLAYESAEDLMRRTPGFWEGFAQAKLNRDFQGMYRFLNEPYPEGPNDYMERIQQNIGKLRQRLGQTEQFRA